MSAENSNSDGELGEEMLEQTVDLLRKNMGKRNLQNTFHSYIDVLQLKTREEIAAKTDELSQVKSQLLATNDY